MPVGDQPQDLVSATANAAFEEIDRYLAHADARCVKALLLLEIEGQPAGEATDVSAGHNIESHMDVLALMAGHLVAAAGELGIQIDLLPVQGRPQG
jgi:hypothetical protein